MAALAACPALSSRAFAARPAGRSLRAQRLVVRASADKTTAQDVVIKTTAFASLAGSFLAAGNAQAAMEVANLAASDNRAGLLLTLGLPVLGWVAFNIGQPAINQLDAMKNKGVVGALALGATSLLMAGSADAATEAMQLAAGDGRAGLLFTLLVPVLGWVLFNIGQPAINQLDAMKNKGVIGAAGLSAASLLMAGNADAATEAMQLAAGDNRTGILLTLFVPVIGWVLFNILGPAQNQLKAMSEKQKKGFAAAAGLSAASLLMAGNADAATEAMQLAAGDNRTGILLTLFVPVIGWVLFNILGPAQNQLKAMSEKQKKGFAAAAGLSAASLLMAGNADAATEAMQLAAGDNRTGILLTLFVPVIGWVLFNILGPAQNQLKAMSEKQKKGFAAATGLSAASLLMVGSADAATEAMQLAAGDNRTGILLTLFVPVIGWVLFNILGPAQNQLKAMSEKKR